MKESRMRRHKAFKVETVKTGWHRGRVMGICGMTILCVLGGAASAQVGPQGGRPAQAGAVQRGEGVAPKGIAPVVTPLDIRPKQPTAPPTGSSQPKVAAPKVRKELDR